MPLDLDHAWVLETGLWDITEPHEVCHHSSPSLLGGILTHGHKFFCVTHLLPNRSPDEVVIWVPEPNQTCIELEEEGFKFRCMPHLTEFVAIIVAEQDLQSIVQTLYMAGYREDINQAPYLFVDLNESF